MYALVKIFYFHQINFKWQGRPGPQNIRINILWTHTRKDLKVNPL